MKVVMSNGQIVNLQILLLSATIYTTEFHYMYNWEVLRTHLTSKDNANYLGILGYVGLDDLSMIYFALISCAALPACRR